MQIWRSSTGLACTTRLWAWRGVRQLCNTVPMRMVLWQLIVRSFSPPTHSDKPEAIFGSQVKANVLDSTTSELKLSFSDFTNLLVETQFFETSQATNKVNAQLLFIHFPEKHPPTHACLWHTSRCVQPWHTFVEDNSKDRVPPIATASSTCTRES